MKLPLADIHVLEVFGQYPGPYCAMLMGDLGAEVIKIEKPHIGDPVRQFDGFFQAINRNKKSLTLNLKVNEGRRIFYKLAKKADVIIEGFRPGVAQKLKIDYNSVKRVNPKIIYCAISNFGQSGPYKYKSAHDLNCASIAGIIGVREKPVKLTIQIGDLASGLFALVSILSALILRKKNKRGQYIDVSLLNTLVSLMSSHIGTYFSNPDKPYRGSPLDFNPVYEIYETLDGRFISLGIAHEDHFWKELCKLLDIEKFKNFTNTERIQNYKKLYYALKQIFLTKRCSEWVKIFKNSAVPFSTVYTIEEAVKDPQLLYRQTITENENHNGRKIKLVKFPADFSLLKIKYKPSPFLGQHTTELLKKLGYHRKEIEKLKKIGTI